jgi:hypothetical protein
MNFEHNLENNLKLLSIYKNQNNYRILENKFNADFASFCERVLLKTFQNLSVSSPAPVTIDSPSGDMA